MQTREGSVAEKEVTGDTGPQREGVILNLTTPSMPFVAALQGKKEEE
jgi:hypothetical protein